MTAYDPVTIGDVTFYFFPSGSASFSETTYDWLVVNLYLVHSRDPNLFDYDTPQSMTVIREDASVMNGSSMQISPDYITLKIDESILYDLGTADGPSTINAWGDRLLFTAERLLFHELTHKYLEAIDIPGPTYLDILTGISSDSAPDIVGSVVDRENQFYSGLTSQRMEYFTGYLGDESAQNLNFSSEYQAFMKRDGFTGGHQVDLVLGDNVVANYGESIGISTLGYIGKPDDLIFGFGGNDKIESWGGDDFLYGNDGNDILVGGEGRDTLYGDNGDGPGQTTGNDYLFGGDWNGDETTTQPLSLTTAQAVKWLDGVSDRLEGGAGYDTYYAGALKSDQYTIGWTAGGGVQSDILNYIDVIKDTDGQGQIFAYTQQGGLGAPGYIYRGGNLQPGTIGLWQLGGSFHTDSFYPGRYLDGAGLAIVEYIVGAITTMVVYTADDAVVPHAALVALEGFHWGDFGITYGGGPDPNAPPPNTAPPAPAAPGAPPTQGGTGTIGNDRIDTASADDIIDPLDGNDYVRAGAGNDTIRGGAGADTIDGCAGFDTVDYSASSAGVTISLNAAVQSGGDAQGDVLISINSIVGTAFNDNITGNETNNYLSGGGGTDTLSGLDGNDILEGGAGTDTLVGGLGNDIYIVDTTTDTITEGAGAGTGTDTVQSSVTYTLTAANVENLTLIGSAAISGTGSSGNNTITGNGANNTLNGGAGTDTLVGGLGDDIYVVDTTTDTITEAAGEGTDTVQSSVTYTLVAANVENLTLTGAGVINGTGNALNNVITGNSANNTLNGNDGADTLNGGSGTDTLVGGLGDDIYVVDTTTDAIAEAAGAGTDTVQSSVTYTLTAANVENLTLIGSAAINGTGSAINNVINGNTANNTLNGGAGANDTLVGGLGNDIYVVDTTTDTIVELVGEGTDTVQSAVTYTLTTANVENLTLTGTGVINGTGNAQSNVIIGNSAVNTLTGGDGDDTLDGGAGIDTLIGGFGNDLYIITGTNDAISELAGEGTDTVQSSGTYTLTGAVGWQYIENLTLTGTGVINGTGNAQNNVLTGNSAVNTLTGGDGDDTLDGGAGIDALIGGLGNDIYIITGTNDTVTELAGGGTDTVQSSVTYTLDGTGGWLNIENLTLTGTGVINGTGNAVANVIVGNAGNNTINGRLSNDVLTGGAGADFFVFDSALGASNIDTITDFLVVDDTMRLENTGAGLFNALTTVGTLATNAFWIGSAAHLASDRIIYDSVTGWLSYDADGTGAAAAVRFATLGTGLALTNADFVVI